MRYTKMHQHKQNQIRFINKKRWKTKSCCIWLQNNTVFDSVLLSAPQSCPISCTSILPRHRALHLEPDIGRNIGPRLPMHACKQACTYAMKLLLCVLFIILILQKRPQSNSSICCLWNDADVTSNGTCNACFKHCRHIFSNYVLEWGKCWCRFARNVRWVSKGRV